jgi:hypothetical protein
MALVVMEVAKDECSNLKKRKRKTKIGSRQWYINRGIFVSPIKTP